jgi:hypothetical protein
LEVEKRRKSKSKRERKMKELGLARVEIHERYMTATVTAQAPERLYTPLALEHVPHRSFHLLDIKQHTALPT